MLDKGYSESGVSGMADTKFVCAVCGSAFSEHEASASTFESEEDEIRCPNCGSAQVETDHFDPNEPLVDPREGSEDEGYIS
ncbi:MAG: hypothetical protein AVDCRST_MAG37-1646 [uncultured Rubrobacteraceae bacterium]|uniref:Rubredoxin-like domain-containing protein n=1 Tax=uncultured Rubrobacteraceae bacterium TaxID=349277 RepID=A0A6J4QME2_9ACTN|nr:MAG: hypothetical protein AVDCRST_MAG37-1646 [uncultured Rubrobacteraceae bacterium]